MKTIKNTFFSLLVLFVGTSLITSCSKDDETNSNVSENAKVSNYLKSFYSNTYQLGKSVETNPKSATSSLNRGTEVENFVLTEVFVGDDTRARGYVITDKSTNDFLYFIDVDRINFKLTSVKIDVNDTKVFNHIDELDKYIVTNELDYIKIAENYANEIENNVSNKRPFWGYSDPVPSGAIGHNTDGTAGCFQGLYHTHYVFWIATGPEEPYQVNGVNQYISVPCP